MRRGELARREREDREGGLILDGPGGPDDERLLLGAPVPSDARAAHTRALPRGLRPRRGAVALPPVHRDAGDGLRGDPRLVVRRLESPALGRPTPRAPGDARRGEAAP